MNLEKLIPKVCEHAAKEAPRECCGLAVVVKGRLRYWPCKNVSLASDQFEIDPLDYAAAEAAGEVVGVCHSHVFVNPQPSDADRFMCEQSGVPWLIVNHPVGTYTVTEPSGHETPLVGRAYSYGILDCYQVVVDHYRRTLGIELMRVPSHDKWWERGENLYVSNFEKAGFVQVDDTPREHDCLLIQVGASVPNHVAVYLGDGLILQHVQGRLSSRDVYGGYWQKHTTHILRHRSLA